MADLLKEIESLNLGQTHTYLGFKEIENPYYAFELYNKKIEKFISEFISSLANDKDTELRYLKEITEVLFKELKLNEKDDDKCKDFEPRSDNSTTKKQVLDLVSRQVNYIKGLDEDFNLTKVLAVLDSTLNGFVENIDPKVDLDDLIKKDFNLYKAVIAARSGTTVEEINIEEQQISGEFDTDCEKMYNLAKDKYNEFQKLKEGINSRSKPLENKDEIKQKRQELLEDIKKLDVNIKEQVANKKVALGKYHNTLKDKYDFENNQGSIQEAMASFFKDKIKYLKKVANSQELIKQWIDRIDYQSEQIELETTKKWIKNLKTLKKQDKRRVYHKLVEGEEKYVVGSKKAVDNRYKVSVVEKKEDGKEETTILFDPNKPITFGEKFKDENLSLGTVNYSPDGKYAVYRIKINGTDECEINVCDIEETLKARKENENAPIVNTAADFKPLLKSGFIVLWSADSTSFFYEQASQGQNEHGQSCLWYDLVEHNISDKSFEKDTVVIKADRKEAYAVTSGPLLLYDQDGSLKQTDFRYFVTARNTCQVCTIDPEGNKSIILDGTRYGSQGKVEEGKGDGKLEILCKFGNHLIATTNYDAPYNRLVLIDINNHSPENWKTLSKPNDTRVLHSASLYFVRKESKTETEGEGVIESEAEGETTTMTPTIRLHYEVDTASHNEIYKIKGTGGDIKLSDPKVMPLPNNDDNNNTHQTLIEAGGAKPGDTTIEVRYSSINTAPGDIYEYKFINNTITRKHREWQEREGIIDPSKIIVERLWTESKDGTRIPMTVYRRPDTKLDGTAALRMYGYGGFKHKETPGYNYYAHNFVNEGGIYVVTNIRGGGEYGEDWHKKGILENKQNTFDDFIACAEALQGDRPYGIGNKDEESKEELQYQKYTSKKRMVIDGASNGGLLTVMCATQRPDLFAGVRSHYPMLDMMRFNKFGNGKTWETDFGRVDSDLLEHLAARANSPVHQGELLKHLPPTFVHAADKDDRVDLSNALKLVALAHKQGNKNLVLKIIKNLGHSAGNIDQTIRNQVAYLEFITRTIGPINQKEYKLKAIENQVQLSETDLLAFTAQPQPPIAPIAPVEEPRRKSFVTRSNLFQTPCKGKGF